MSKPATYHRIRLERLPSHLEGEITTYCFKKGALGVSEALQYRQPDLTYEPEVVHLREHDVDVFFAEKPSQDFFDGLRALRPEIQWQSFEEEHKDWLAEWKKDFKAFKLVQNIWVVPSWLTPPSEAETPLLIDPGMAFGTGTHATTQIAAAMVYKLSQKVSPQQSLLDVGTGTAILALLAEKLGFSPIMGVEIDPEARRVAKENVDKNNTKNILIVDENLEDLHESFDVVVANIIDGILLKIRKELLKATRIDGHLIVTGILKERDNEFFDEFTKGTNLKVQRRLEKDEWVGYWFKNQKESQES